MPGVCQGEWFGTMLRPLRSAGCQEDTVPGWRWREEPVPSWSRWIRLCPPLRDVSFERLQQLLGYDNERRPRQGLLREQT